MYSSGLSYSSRYRPTHYDEISDRYHSGHTTNNNNNTSRITPDYSWLGSHYRSTNNTYQPSSATTTSRKYLNDTSALSMANSKSAANTAELSSASASARRPRYTRSSTHSVAQLLSDSCSSLLQKITTRVRGPSATVERQLLQNSSSSSNLIIHPQSNHHPLTTSKSSTVVPNLGNSPLIKSRNDDTNNSSNNNNNKYTSVLDRIYGKRKESERKPLSSSDSAGRSLTKSSTTGNVLQLSEKAYPYVNNSSSSSSSVVQQREKTPFRNNEHHQNSSRKNSIVYPEPSYSYLDRDNAYRVRHRSNHSELRPRRSSKPQRVGKSEHNERKTSLLAASTTTNLKLSAVEIPILNENNFEESKEEEEEEAAAASSSSINASSLLSIHLTPEDDDTTPTPAVPDPVSEREAKRKEIQSLIMKYSALDEAYNKTKAAVAATNVVHEPPKSVAAIIAQKYYPETTKLAAAVSKELKKELKKLKKCYMSLPH